MNSVKEKLGFGNGYITLFKGDTFPFKEYFQSQSVKYNKIFRWFLPSTTTLTKPLPMGITPIELKWEEVSVNNELLPNEQLEMIVNQRLYDTHPSEFIGTPGERLELKLHCDKTREITNDYGLTIVHMFTDENGNEYTWNTSSRNLETGVWYKGKCTIKAHNLYRNRKQNQLKNCRLEKCE